jgi:hypothetical protein
MARYIKALAKSSIATKRLKEVEHALVQKEETVKREKTKLVIRTKERIKREVTLAKRRVIFKKHTADFYKNIGADAYARRILNSIPKRKSFFNNE